MKTVHYRVLLAGAAAAATLLAAACGPSSSGRPDRRVDVSQLTFQDVKDRARAAAWRTGFVTHSSASSSIAGHVGVKDSWVDLDRHVARIDRDGQVSQVFSPDRMAMINPLDGRYQEALYDYPGFDEPLLAFTLDYLVRIIGPGAENKRIEEAVVDGQPAIMVEVSQPRTGDYRGTETARIYLDESFLPLRVELDPGVAAFPHSTEQYRVEHLASDDLAPDFFSFEQVRRVAKSSAESVLVAARGFDRVFWLGDPFEEMTLLHMSGHTLDNGEPALNLDYGLKDAGAGGPDAPFPCAQINEYTPKGWESLQAARERQGNPAVALPTVEAGGRAPLPGISGVTFGDVVVEVSTRCGPPGKNRFASSEGEQHLLDSLTPLMRP